MFVSEYCDVEFTAGKCFASVHCWHQIRCKAPFPDQKWNKLNNVEAILVVRISIRINFVSIGVRVESLSETFYPDADDIRTALSKISRQKDIN